MATHKDGKEFLDDTPVSLPAGFKRPPSIHDMIRQYIRTESFAQKANAAGFDTEAEANDFEVDEDEDIIITRHEFAAMAGDEAMRLSSEEKYNKIRDALKEAQRNGPKQGEPGVDGVGSVGKAGKGDGGAERGNSAGNRKAPIGAPKPAGPGELAEQG